MHLNSKYTGIVYHVAYKEVLVDFGCETTGILPRSEIPAATRGDTLRVVPVRFDDSIGRFKLKLECHGETLQNVVDPVQWVVKHRPAPGESLRLMDRRTGDQALEVPSSGWVEVLTDDGKAYYWDLATGETTWTKPEV